MNAPAQSARSHPAHGEPLVLLHGIQASRGVWAPVIPELEQHHAVFAPNLPGHAGGPPLPDGVKASALTLGDGLERILDENGIEQAHFAGNSLGGWLSLEMARRGRALSVVALSPAGAFLRDKDRKRVIKMLSQARKMGIALGPKLGPLVRRPGGRKLLVRIASERGDLMTAAEMAASFDDLAACTIFEDFVHSVHTDGGIAEGIDVSAQPIRIAWGANDRVLPFKRYGQPMLDLLPGADHVMLPGVGHVPMWDDPQLIARTILEVTAREASAPPGNGATPTPIDTSAPAEKETPSMTATSTDFEFAGTQGKIVARAWSGAEPRYAVLLAHGFGEHSGRYEHVAAALVADGAVVYAPDHLAHGRSEGAQPAAVDIEPMVDDLHTVADRLRAEHPGLPLVLIGHSMGGLIATRFTQRHGDELQAVVLSGPFLGNPAFEGLLGMDPIPEIPLDPAMLSRDPAVGEAYAADELVYHDALRRDQLEGLFAGVPAVDEGPTFGALPTLHVHGTADALAPWEVSKPVIERLASDSSDFEAHPYEGAAHEVYNETNKDEVITTTISFINKHV